MTTEFGGFLLICLAVYLGVVANSGNVTKLLDETAKEVGYVKWIFALVVVYWLWRSNAAGQVVSAIAGLGLLGALFAIMQTKGVQDVIKEF